MPRPYRSVVEEDVMVMMVAVAAGASLLDRPPRNQLIDLLRQGDGLLEADDDLRPDGLARAQRVQTIPPPGIFVKRSSNGGSGLRGGSFEEMLRSTFVKVPSLLDDTELRHQGDFGCLANVRNRAQAGS